MRLKDDELRFLQALRLGAADSARLSPGRRTALQRQFERKGWIKDGQLTKSGHKAADKNPLREQPEESVERQSDDSLNERQSNGSDEPDIHRPEWKGVDSSP